jgi:hypothetical protein
MVAKPWGPCARRVSRGPGIAITREQFLASFGQRNDSIIPQWLGAAATPERIDRIANAKEELYRHLIRRDGISPSPGLRIGYTSFTSRDGFKRSRQPRRARTSMRYLRLCRPATFSRASSPLKMSTAANRIRKCIW